jgi:hypothetical protein
LPNTVYGSAIKNTRELFGLNAWEPAHISPYHGLVISAGTVALAINLLTGIVPFARGISTQVDRNLLLNRIGL